MRNLTLNNGKEMPIVGSGTNTYGKEGNIYGGALRGDNQEMDWAIENGYRHFDSAQVYYNEETVGAGIANSGLPREAFFITSKLNTSEGFPGVEWAKEEIAKSLEKLQTDYLDLFLIHFPWENKDEILEAWTLLEDYYDQGVFKAIGVSNFTPELIDFLVAKARIKPMVNQIESHPGKWQDDWIEHNQKNDIVVTAWSPLKGIDDHSHAILEEIAEKYGKTWAQVLLAYQVQRDVIVIPKSHNKERQAHSLDIFDFKLTDEEKEKIAAL